MDLDTAGLGLGDSQVEYGALDAADLNNTQGWNPRYIKADTPCEPCQVRQLACTLSFGQVACTACETSHTVCSFAELGLQQVWRDAQSHSHWIFATMPPVPKEDTSSLLTPSGREVSAISLESDDVQARKVNVRFSRAAVKILREWLASRSDDPYPTEKEKERLKRQTGLTPCQISTWLANARRRNKLGKPRQRPRGSSPRPTSSASAIDIVNGNATPWDEVRYRL